MVLPAILPLPFDTGLPWEVEMNAKEAYENNCRKQGIETVYEQVQDAISNGNSGCTCQHRLPESVIAELHCEGFSIRSMDYVGGGQVHYIWWGP